MTARPFIPVANTASVELIYSVAGYLAENVFHVEADTPFDLTALQNLRTLVNSWDASTWFFRRHGGVTLDRIRTKACDSKTAPMEDYALSPHRAGNQGGVCLPLGSTFCIKLSSAAQGRSQRGRWYFVGLASGQIYNSNQMVGSEADAIVSALQVLRNNLFLHVPSWRLVVTSYRTDKAWRTAGHNTTVTNIGYVNLDLDSQRRRLAGRGHS